MINIQNIKLRFQEPDFTTATCWLNDFLIWGGIFDEKNSLRDTNYSLMYKSGNVDGEKAAKDLVNTIFYNNRTVTQANFVEYFRTLEADISTLTQFPFLSEATGGVETTYTKEDIASIIANFCVCQGKDFFFDISDLTVGNLNVITKNTVIGAAFSVYHLFSSQDPLASSEYTPLWQRGPENSNGLKTQDMYYGYGKRSINTDMDYERSAFKSSGVDKSNIRGLDPDQVYPINVYSWHEIFAIVGFIVPFPEKTPDGLIRPDTRFYAYIEPLNPGTKYYDTGTGLNLVHLNASHGGPDPSNTLTGGIRVQCICYFRERQEAIDFLERCLINNDLSHIRQDSNGKPRIDVVKCEKISRYGYYHVNTNCGYCYIDAKKIDKIGSERLLRSDIEPEESGEKLVEKNNTPATPEKKKRFNSNGVEIKEDFEDFWDYAFRD